MTARDPLAMSLTVEGARLALLKAGPASGIHGAAAADVDARLTEVVQYLKDCAKRLDERKREART